MIVLHSHNDKPFKSKPAETPTTHTSSKARCQRRNVVMDEHSTTEEEESWKDGRTNQTHPLRTDATLEEEGAALRPRAVALLETRLTVASLTRLDRTSI